VLESTVGAQPRDRECDAGRPIRQECSSLPGQHRRQLSPMLLDGIVKPFLD
jgi:hypothetical protein